jgi:hypothetical protein
MATLYDGIAVFAAADGAVALAADQNTLQAKLILGLQARWKSVDIAFGKRDDTATNWDFQCDGITVPYWDDSTGGSFTQCIIPCSFREDERITDVKVIVRGNPGAGGTGDGGIKLYEMDADVTPAVKSTIATLGGATPWATAGAWTEYTSSGLTHDCAADGTIHFDFTTHDRAVTGNSQISACRVKTMFHKGT